ncbi:MAG: response regulator [Candidatus Sericytochromatia bacterium]
MRVLIVEDDPHSQELLVMRLEAMGCEPLPASGIDEAFDLAVARRPHMILLDLKLNEGTGSSGFEGVQLLGRLREHAETAEIPVVIHSIFVRHPAEAPAPIPRVDGFLFKPFKFDDLRELVDQHRPPADD